MKTYFSENNIYRDDSISRYLAKLNYHKRDIVNILRYDTSLSDDDNDVNTFDNNRYLYANKVWEYIFNLEDDTKKNIFYLYFYECKTQSQIAYLVGTSQAYISKVLKKLIYCLIKQFNVELNGEENGKMSEK